MNEEQLNAVLGTIREPIQNKYCVDTYKQVAEIQRIVRIFKINVREIISYFVIIFTILRMFAAKIVIAPCISMHDSPYDRALSYPNTFFNSEFFASILYRSLDNSLKRSVFWNFI